MIIDTLPEAETRLGMLVTFQPVYASNLDVHAFRLLAESGAGREQHLAHDISAIQQLIVENYTSIYQNGELQTLPCLLSVDAETLISPDFPELPRGHFIIELKQPCRPTPVLVQHLQSLARKGYLLALDGLAENGESLAPLLQVIHMLRLDFSRISADEMPSLLAELKPYGLDLLADKLTHPEQFRTCLEAGFRLFCGTFFAEPRQVRGKIPGTDKLQLMELLACLENPECSLDEIEDIIIRDANLTYRFLKLANAASYGINREIEVLSHALTLLGTRQIQRWVTLFLLEGHDSKPAELSRKMLVRARMCEVLAVILSRPNPVSYFIVGLLSQLDLLTDMAMEDLMSNVPLSQEIKAALLDRKGEMGILLQEVEDYEKGHFQALRTLPERHYYEVSYRHSTAWANQLLASKSADR